MAPVNRMIRQAAVALAAALASPAPPPGWRKL